MNTKVTWLQQVIRTSEQEYNEPRGALTSGDLIFGRSTPCSAESEAALLPDEEHLEYLALTPDNMEAWIETQLLDCQNIARQHGLIKAAAVLDSALDQIALGSGLTSNLAFQIIS